jgi:exportin-1
VIKQPLWDLASKPPTAYPSNEAFVREHVVALLTSSFPNLTQNQVGAAS